MARSTVYRTVEWRKGELVVEQSRGEMDQDRDIDLVLVTGAGASREFGERDKPLPLMADWSNTLFDKLCKANNSYLEITGLEKGLSGEKFEERLGTFLRQVLAFPSGAELIAQSMNLPNTPECLKAQGVLDRWFDDLKSHHKQITQIINESLYELFANVYLNVDGAVKAYGTLLTALEIKPQSNSLVVATTNYDPLAEAALQKLGYIPDWGMSAYPRGQEELFINVGNILDGMPRYTPVLHLHGRVGWHRRPGEDNRVYAQWNPQYSRNSPEIPVVMLPDPEKMYGSDDVINTLWGQFTQALSRAKLVFVLGHSLNDKRLVEALLQNVYPVERIMISALPDGGNATRFDPNGGPLVSNPGVDKFPETWIPMRFQEQPLFATERISELLKRYRLDNETN